MTSWLRAALMTLALSAMATVPVAAGDAGHESPFSFGAGARAIGMGGGLASLADGPASIYYNPAGLSQLQWQEVSAMHASLFEGTIWDYAAWVYPLSNRRGFGVSYMRLGTGDIERRVNYNPDGTFGYTTWQFTLAYGNAFTENISGGVALKIVNQQLDQYSTYAVGADLGLQWYVYRRLALGVIARDIISPRLKLNVNAERSPTTIAGGVSLNRAALSKVIDLTLAADLMKIEGRQAQFLGGAELTISDRYTIRGGYDRKNVALGAGLRQGRLSIDYAWKMLPEELDDAHSFSLSFRLGTSIDEQMRIADSIRNAPPQLTEEEKRKLALREKANRFFHNFELDSALAYFRQLYELSPGDQELIGTIAAIENAQEVQREQEAKLEAAELERQQYLSSYYDQANVFFGKKYYRAALDMLNLIFDIDPNNVRALALKTDIEKSIAGEVKKYFESAHLAEQDGRFTEAVESYNSVLELNPGDSAALAAKRGVLSKLDLAKQLDQAIQLYNTAKYDEAEQRFRAVLEINPNDSVARGYLSRIAAAQKHTATFDELQADRTIWNLYVDGMRYYRDKDYEKAIESWQKVLDAYPGQPNTLENIEQARRRLKTQ